MNLVHAKMYIFLTIYNHNGKLGYPGNVITGKQFISSASEKEEQKLTFVLKTNKFILMLKKIFKTNLGNLQFNRFDQDTLPEWVDKVIKAYMV